VTAIGRPEYDYLYEAALSLVSLEALVPVEWRICVDGPAVDPCAVAEAVERAGMTAAVTVVMERRGAGPARNSALRGIAAEYLLTLDADDMIDAVGVVRLLEALEQWPEAMWAAGRCHSVNVDGALLWEGPSDPFEPGLIPITDTFWHAKCRTGGLPFICTATLARTDAIRHVGGWPEPARRRADDTALWGVISTQFTGVWVPAVIYFYRRHAASTTNQLGFRRIDERLDQTARMVSRGTTRDYL